MKKTQTTTKGKRFTGSQDDQASNSNDKSSQIDVGKRTKCEIYTRVMGYYRPVSFFNEGKKSEYYSRTCFNEEKSFNSSFIENYES